MEPDGSPQTSRRKVKFAPKSPARKKLRAIPLKKELIDEDDEGASEAQTLLRQFNENLARRMPKFEKKTQVVFGAGATTSSSIRSFGVPKAARASKSSNTDLKSSDDEQIPILLPSKIAENFPSSEEVAEASTLVPKKEYLEPWDYDNSYYPTILPMRPPSSGDPEILDAAEFREAARDGEYKENATNPASELGLMEQNEEGKMFFFQLPPILPLVKRPASTKGKEKVGCSASSSEVRTAPSKGCKLEELPGGYLGKMLVYKSGAVKLKLGNMLYDVSPGIDTSVSQDAMAINTAKKQCCVLGELRKRAVVSPNLDHLLNSVIDLG